MQYLPSSLKPLSMYHGEWARINPPGKDIPLPSFALALNAVNIQLTLFQAQARTAALFKNPASALYKSLKILEVLLQFMLIEQTTDSISQNAGPFRSVVNLTYTLRTS